MFHYAVALLAAFVVYEVACQTVGGNRTNGTGNSTINGTGGGNGTGGRNGTDGGDEGGVYYISADLVSGVLYEVVSVLLSLIYALGGFGYGEEFGGNSTNSSNRTGPY